ncbi:hypothetical protein ACFX1Z_018250 [Malus domestica]
MVENEDTSTVQIMKYAKANNKGFILGLIVGTIEIQLKGKEPTVLVWGLEDDPHADRCRYVGTIEIHRPIIVSCFRHSDFNIVAPRTHMEKGGGLRNQQALVL